jgi:hypothetical protein
MRAARLAALSVAAGLIACGGAEAPPPNKGPTWWVQTPDGKEFGPVTAEEFHARYGTARAVVRVRREKTGMWVSPEMERLLAKPAPAAPPAAGPEPPAPGSIRPVAPEKRLPPHIQAYLDWVEGVGKEMMGVGRLGEQAQARDVAVRFRALAARIRGYRDAPAEAASLHPHLIGLANELEYAANLLERAEADPGREAEVIRDLDTIWVPAFMERIRQLSVERDRVRSYHER